MRALLSLLILLGTMHAAEAPRLIAIDRTAFAAEYRPLIDACNADLEAISSGQFPVNAKFQVMEMDGGTRHFQGRGYRITLYRQWCAVGGVTSYMIGPKVEFEPPLADRDLDLSVSFVRVVPASELPKRTSNKSEVMPTAVTPPGKEKKK